MQRWRCGASGGRSSSTRTSASTCSPPPASSSPPCSQANAITADDLISIVFTVTADLRSEFPALAARELGMGDVPLLCTVEIDVPGAMPRVVRLMAHAEMDVPRAQVQHVYLRGAVGLRRDLAQ